MSPDQVANGFVSLLFSIATLVAISLGLAVVFGMMRVINLAHGEFLMLGAFATLSFDRAGLPIWVAMGLAPVAVGLIGYMVERLLIRHLYGRLVDTMLATFGLSLVLTQLVVIVYGPATQGVATPLGSFRVGDYSISGYTIAFIGLAALLLGAVWLVFTRTLYGVRARAATQMPHMAAAVGVNTSQLNGITFAFGCALAGAAGALLAPITGVVPYMGTGYIARAFMTVVVGGPGVISGTTAASGILGGTENLTSYFTTSFFGQAALLLLAIVLVRLRPHGLSAGWKGQL